jgi:hypothetical protein
MSLEEDLDILAEACEACAEKDVSSIDEHLDNCPACKSFQEKVLEKSQMVETLQMMASKPEAERHKILGARIESFSTMSTNDRKNAISDMLYALGELTEDERIKIVKTRTNILTKLPKEKRTVLMGTLKEIMSVWTPERKMIEQRALMAATEDYFLLKKIMVRKMFSRLM